MAVGGDQDTWLGLPVGQRGVCVYLAGEDSKEIIAERALALDSTNSASKVISCPSDSRDLKDIIDGLMGIPDLLLLIVDPCRKYIVADEDSSDSVNRFFTTLEDFAKEKGCAVIVVHHLGKNAKPRSLADVRASIRGSGVFIDRPRAILGMFRRGESTVIGLCKNNLPPSCGMVEGARTFRREAATLRHILEDDTGAAKGARKREEPAGSEDTTLPDLIVAAFRTVAGRGIRIVRTGPRELFELSPKTLEGISRAKVRATVKALIDAGRVRIQEDGAMALVE
jgi:hypothetical protein